MGIVNPTEVHPGIVRALYRLCVQRGAESSPTLDEYVAMLAPDGAVGATPNAKLSVRRTVNEATKFGLLQPGEKEGKRYRLALPVPPPGVDAQAAETFFVRNLRQLVFTPANNAPLFAEREGAEEEAEEERGETLATTGAREFTRMQAWLLAQDPTAQAMVWGGNDPRRRGVQALQSRDKGRPLAVNGNRWTAFRRWSLYLGLSRQDGSGGVIPDPSRAISDELSNVLGGAEEMPLVDFIDRLAKVLPVVDGGSYKAEVVRYTGTPDPAGAVSPSLALSLLRLEAAGRVRLEARADFGAGSMSVGRKQITHLVEVPDR